MMQTLLIAHSPSKLMSSAASTGALCFSVSKNLLRTKDHATMNLKKSGVPTLLEAKPGVNVYLFKKKMFTQQL